MFKFSELFFTYFCRSSISSAKVKNTTLITISSTHQFILLNLTPSVLTTLFVLDHLYELIPSIGLLLSSEVFVDWVKHAFITKFNCISSEVGSVFFTS